METSTSTRVQLASAYSCYFFIGLFAIGFLPLAGFLPPPRPTAAADEVAALFRDRAGAIRAGMCVCVAASAFLLPWGAAVGAQLRRIERLPTLTYTWVCANTILAVLFIYPCLWWAVAAFRPDGDLEIIQRFNDMAWLGFMGIISTALIQCLVLAVATFADVSPDPVYPRWFGYFQAWCGVLLTPDLVVYCFKSGPVAWNGIFAFWTEITVAFLWLIVTTHMTARAAREQSTRTMGGLTLEQRIAALESERAVQA